jgi:hypothetical protein
MGLRTGMGRYFMSEKPMLNVMVSWMHNTAIDINNIHRGTQRIGLKTLCSLCPLWLNPVAFTACVGSIRPQQKPILNWKRRDHDGI